MKELVSKYLSLAGLSTPNCSKPLAQPAERKSTTVKRTFSIASKTLQNGYGLRQHLCSTTEQTRIGTGIQTRSQTRKEQIMKSYKAYSDSAYLKKEDFRDPESLTIDEVREEEVTAPGSKPKHKLVLYFKEIEKGLVLNQANGDALFEMTGHDDPEKWVGRNVEVYHDPNVTYAGKRVGGIRLRKPAAVPVEEAVPF